MAPVPGARSSYQIRGYQAGFERDQARIGREVARGWIWPYAYDEGDLLRIHARPGFDPGTRHYAFLGGEMVGYCSSLATPGEGGARTATLDFPRVLPGHEVAAQPLLKTALEALKRKGVVHVTGRVTTMCPGDVRLAEQAGFAIRDWGYKVYYAYDMSRGPLDVPGDPAEDIDPVADLDACAALAARWYRRPVEWCRDHLAAWHAEGIIAHVGVRQGGRLVAACLAARNSVRPSTAANYSIYAPDESCLEPMLARVVAKCVEAGVHDLIADLINEHRPFEPVYRRLGFQKVAEWARCELRLD